MPNCIETGGNKSTFMPLIPFLRLMNNNNNNHGSRGGGGGNKYGEADYRYHQSCFLVVGAVIKASHSPRIFYRNQEGGETHIYIHIWSHLSFSRAYKALCPLIHKHIERQTHTDVRDV